ncbi:hypothetical protein ACQJBY_007397 [Aegilops geniculata]
MSFMRIGGCKGTRLPPLGPPRRESLAGTSEQAPLLAVGGVVAVRAGAEQEDGEGAEHHDARDAEAEAPADVVLDVAEEHERDGGAGAYAEVPPVEEGAPGDGLPRVARVELVGAEGLDARLVPALRQGHQVEGGVERGHLQTGRRRAGRAAVGVAAFVIAGGEQCRESQHA